MFAEMLPRRLHDRLGYLLDHTPEVVLLGPRQVGKTTLGSSAFEVDVNDRLITGRETAG